MSKTYRISYRRPKSRKGIPTERSPISWRVPSHSTYDATDPDSVAFNRALLIETAHRIGYRVIHGDHFFLNRRLRFIQTDERFNPALWTAGMLHELGHAELIHRREHHHRTARSRLIDIEIGFGNYTRSFHQFYLRMEWLAWEQGFIIARREGIRIYTRQYWHYAQACHGTYVDHLRRLTHEESMKSRERLTRVKQRQMKTARRRALLREEEIETSYEAIEYNHER